eukprot:symbB.v1.2.024991.t1/scaffold2394.1/size82379/7
MKDQREVHPSIMQAILKLVQARDRSKLSAGLEMLRYAKVAQLPEEDAAIRTLVSLELEEAIQNRSRPQLNLLAIRKKAGQSLTFKYPQILYLFR